MQVLAKYNVVFQYLLRLKRIQVDLEGAWGVMRRQAGQPRDLPQQTRHLPLWHLRHHMAYIISNLQIYVQVLLWHSAACLMPSGICVITRLTNFQIYVWVLLQHSEACFLL